MEQDGGQEVTEETKTQTGYCKFCGQSGIIYAPKTWSQEEVNEAATCRCECDEAKKYAESKERVQKAKNRITELFGSNAERPIDQDVVTIMLDVVDAIEARHMKGVTIDVGQGVRAKVSKMAKESIKVERTETSKKNNVHDASVTLDPANLEYLCEDCHNKEHKAKPNTRYRFDSDGKLLPPKEMVQQTPPPGGQILRGAERTEGDTSKKLCKVARI